MVQPRAAQPVGCRSRRYGDAERGGRGGRPARRAAERCPRHHLHRIAGPPADDPEHVQDRWGANPCRPARRREVAGGAGAVHLRRPLGRDGRTADRLRAARLRIGPGGTRPRAGGAGGHAGHPGPVCALLRRVPHLARAEHDRAADRRRPAGPGARGADPRAPQPGTVPGAAFHPGHRAEPGRLLPGAGDGEPVLRRGTWRGAGRDGQPRRSHRPRLPPDGVHRAPGSRPGDRRDGLGCADGRRNGCLSVGEGRAGRGAAGQAVPAVPCPGAARCAARISGPDRRARQDQGTWVERRAALPRRGRRAG